jgi:hypothetical protein
MKTANHLLFASSAFFFRSFASPKVPSLYSTVACALFGQNMGGRDIWTKMKLSANNTRSAAIS